jgi:hypothetical protein
MIESVKLASSSSPSSNQPPKYKEDFVTIVSTVVFKLISSSVANHVPATSMVDSYIRIHHLKEGLDKDDDAAEDGSDDESASSSSSEEGDESFHILYILVT